MDNQTKAINTSASKVLASNINLYLNKKGMSMSDLARAIGVSTTSAQNWANGSTVPRMDKVEKMCKIFGCEYNDLVSDHFSLPSNIITPSAYALPILGTICAGGGIVTEQSYKGEFFVDKSIRADYCLKVKGNSMIGEGINSGDIVFIRKEIDLCEGSIYAVVLNETNEAVLKKLYVQGDQIMLVSANQEYKPIIVDQTDICIVGKCVGVFKEW